MGDDADGAIGEALPAGSADERARIERARGGDAEAFAELYETHLDRVYRHVLYRVGNRTDAEDLTQQVFVRAWQALPRYRINGSPFIAWLLTIAHNLIVDFYKSRRVTTPLDDQFDLPSTAIDPAEQALAGVRQMELRQAIRTLRPDYQQIVAMRFLEGFSPAEIAAAIGKSEGNVRVMQHRALAELRKQLQPEVR